MDEFDISVCIHVYHNTTPIIKPSYFLFYFWLVVAELKNVYAHIQFIICRIHFISHKQGNKQILNVKILLIVLRCLFFFLYSIGQSSLSCGQWFSFSICYKKNIRYRLLMGFEIHISECVDWFLASSDAVFSFRVRF